MEKHINAVGILWIASGILGLIIAGIFFIILIGAGIISGLNDGAEALPILAIIASIVSSVILVLSVPSIIGGIGIMKKKEWGRVIGLILAALNILNIPLGTALGVYTFWALLSDEGQKLFVKSH